MYLLPVLAIGPTLATSAARSASGLATTGPRWSHPAAAPRALEVQPFPGTPDAAPQTEITFAGLARWQLQSTTVTGSRSGAHRGRLVVLPRRGGTVFVPFRPFVDGERVTVRVAGIRFSFGVAAPQPIAGRPSYKVRHDIRDSDGFTHRFHSSPGIHPPIAAFSGKVPDPNAGDVFADAENSIQAGPLIFSPQGQLIYFQPLHHAAAFNVEVQRYQGQSVLTYFQGYVSHGVGIGADTIIGQNYQPIATVHAGNNYKADLHEFQITPQGNALISAYAQVHADLRSVGGPRNGTLLDSIIQEINIATGQLIWEWHAYGHIHLKESYQGKPGKTPYDFFHINSIQQLPNGNLLVSGRHTWAVYEINMKTGRIPVVIGGKHSNFKIGSGANFEWQHDAHLAGDTLTVFDNGEGERHRNESQSRALRIHLDFKHRRATLGHAYVSTPPVQGASQGSVQVLPDGNTFVGWGSAPYFSEFSTGGQQLFSMHFPHPLQSYRGYRFPWRGQPSGWPPSIAASATSSGTRLYASWNGATDVASWQVLAGPSQDPTTMSVVGHFRKTNFETTMSVASTAPYFAVQALGSAGQVLSTSAGVPR